MLLERVQRLVHQRDAIGEKENALRPVAPHQKIAQRDDHSRLARARRHHEERFAGVVRFERLAHASNGARLIVPLDDCLADFRVGQLPARRSPLDEQLQLVLLVEALHGARRMRDIVPHPVLIAVRVKDDRALPKLRFQTIRIELRLLLSDARVALGLLRFHESERFPVVAPKHVIDETFLRLIRHSG